MKKNVVLVSLENGFLPSFSIPSLDASLSKKGIEAELLYPMIFGDSVEVTVKRIIEFKPLIVGIGGLFNDRFMIRDLIRALKPYRRDFKIVIGGDLVTPIPEYMVDKLSADIGVVGEGDIIFTKIVENVLGNKSVSNIGGLVFKDDADLINTGKGEYPDKLDELPHLNYEKMPMEYFVSVYKFYKNSPRNNLYTPKSRLGAVLTGRGCAYHCNFCYHFNKFRLVGIPNIISQVKELKERYNINMLKFTDDLTLSNKQRSLDLCNAITKEKLNLNYIVNAHFNQLNEEMVAALKASGCIQVTLGLESGSQEILDKINKGVRIEQMRSGLDLLRKYRINWSGSIQVGQLGETKDDVKKTKQLFYPYIDELTEVKVAVSTPYPGTALYHYGLKTGLIKDNDWLFDRFANTRTLLVNFSKMNDWLVRYFAIKLAFDFTFKKQKRIRGVIGAYIYLFTCLIRKLLKRWQMMKFKIT